MARAKTKVVKDQLQEKLCLRLQRFCTGGSCAKALRKSFEDLTQCFNTSFLDCTFTEIRFNSIINRLSFRIGKGETYAVAYLALSELHKKNLRPIDETY